jgi:hypothetical protein
MVVFLSNYSAQEDGFTLSLVLLTGGHAQNFPPGEVDPLNQVCNGEDQLSEIATKGR